MRAPLSYMPLMPLTVGLMAGIVAARYLPSSLTWAVLIAAAVAAVALGWVRRWIAAATAVAAVCGLALILAHHVAGLPTPDASPVKYKGEVLEINEFQSSRQMIVDVDGLRYNVQLTTQAFEPPIYEGTRIRFECQLQPIVDDGFGDFEQSHDNYYFAQNVGATGYVLPRDLDTVAMVAPTLRRRISGWHYDAVAKIMRSDLTAGPASLLAATFLGDRKAMDETTVAEFRAAGAAHLLALSGLHTALVWLMISFILWPLSHAGWQRTTKIIAILLLWGYVLFTGMSPSVIRAGVMVTMVAIAYLLQRPNSAVNALCAAAIVILLITPEALFDVGFQLSFVAVVGIMIWGKWFSDLEIRRKWLRVVLNALGVTIAAMLATSMITAYNFHHLPLLFLLANVPLAILFPPFLLIGIVWFLGLTAGVDFAPLRWLLEGLYDAMAWIVHGVATLPGAQIERLYFTPWAVATWMLLLVAMGGWVYYRRRAWGFAALAFGLMTASLLAITPVTNTPEIFVTSQRDHTMMLINDGTSVRAFTVGFPQDSTYYNDYWSQRLSEYVGLRRLGAPQISAAQSSLITVGGQKWLIVNSEDVKPEPCDVLLLTKGYLAGEVPIEDMVKMSGASKVILSSDLNHRVHARFMRHLQPLQGIEIHSLTTSPYRATLTQPQSRR